jgi:P27 family predicted phage terminase small subunit
MPERACPLAKQEWDRLVGELATLRLLTHLDRAALAAYCGAYALWAEAMEAIEKYGAMIKSPTGYPAQSPYVALANREAGAARTDAVRSGGQFGAGNSIRGHDSFWPLGRDRRVHESAPKWCH